MRLFLILWAAPLGLFWGWYFLSLNDINFGSIYLSRQLHDLVFKVYGQILGMDPQIIPAMLAKVFAIDTLIIMGIIAFRRRAAIRAWIAERRGAKSVEEEVGEEWTAPKPQAQPESA